MSNLTEQTNLAVVRRLCEDWPRLSRDEFHQLLAPDCHYINVPWPDQPRTGPDEAYDALSRYHGGWRVTLEVLQIVARGDVVLTERLEGFQKPNDNVVHGLYVMGAFELKDGRIVSWRDYFDAAQTKPFKD